MILSCGKLRAGSRVLLREAPAKAGPDIHEGMKKPTLVTQVGLFSRDARPASIRSEEQSGKWRTRVTANEKIKSHSVSKSNTFLRRRVRSGAAAYGPASVPGSRSVKS